MDHKEILRTVCTTFFGISDYDKYEETIDLILKLADKVYQADYNSKEIIDNEMLKDNYKQVEAIVKETTKCKKEFLKSINCKHTPFEILTYLDHLLKEDITEE